MTSAGNPRSGSAPTEPWFTPGDIDGFFGLFFSGFPDLLLIVGLAPICGFPAEFVVSHILPGTAISVLAGNLFYAWQARRLAYRTGRADVTAIPFGVNTPTIFAYVFLIMGPIYARTHDSTLAWHAGVFASLLSGILQTLLAFVTDRLRRHTPRAALLAPLAGLSLAYLAMGFVLGVFDHPSIALFPMLVLFTLYASRLRLPFRLPPGLIAIALGAALVAILRAVGLYTAPIPATPHLGLYLPHPVNLLQILTTHQWASSLTIVLPLALLDTVASLMILESVKVAGDNFATTPSLLVNGSATLLAAALGSPFPTTLYVGHAAHKDNGARTGYSILNGLVTFALCLTGVLPLVLRFIPLPVAAPVIVWFGLVTIGQAFTEIPRRHAVAVAIGLIPALAAWVSGLLDTLAQRAGTSLFALAPKLGEDFALGGLIALGQGSLLTALIWAATLALITDRRFLAAAAWLALATLLSTFGLIHAFTLTPTGLEGHLAWNAAPAFALSYAAGSLFLLLCHAASRKQIAPEAWPD